MSSSNPKPFAVRFFDEQFQRQVASGEFALNPFEKLALAHVHGTVLDLGCGLGNLSIEAARRGCEVVAVDASPTAVERLQRAAAQAGLSVRACEADLSTYAIDATYDTVVSIGLLMFFDRARAQALLEAIRAAVRPGGIAIVNTLIEGTTFTAMFDPDRHCLFGCTAIEEAFSEWTVIESKVDRFPAPGGTEKVFSTVIAQRPLTPSRIGLGETTAAGGDRVPESERAVLREWVRDARGRTLGLVEDLTDDQLLGPRLEIVNPLRWELGHVAWFQEWWVLRHAAGRAPIRGDADALFDSAAIPHRVRWDLPLPDRAETLRYLQQVGDRVLERIDSPELSERDAYFVRLSVFHEDMHDEAFTYTRQTLSYSAPRRHDVGTVSPEPSAGLADLDDARIPGGVFRLGAEPTNRASTFVFDNEKWAHDVEIAPFSIARAAVSQGEFAHFVEDGGYRRRDLWAEEGWAWRSGAGADGPAYWRREGAGWSRRHFDRWVPLEPRCAMVHVNAFEAEAYCRWAGRRLPTEAEWEVAATGEPDASGGLLAARKRLLPWSRAGGSPRPEHANLDGRADGTVDVAAFPACDSAFGCRQLWGNVWEWTSSAFAPYPGFVPDPYKEYSEPWFHAHRVLRGGCSWTRTRLLRSTWRNFYTPDRRDVFAGFRTCALS